jgi:two-component sensor histidine kinase
LLVNELTTNALKHAFPGGRQGKVLVRYSTNVAETVLEISDDGVGLPAEMVLRARTGHSGFRLIEGFVDQLDGQLTIDRAAGTSIAVTLRPGSGK